MAAPPLLILVHGTGAGAPDPADRHWWESENQTAQDLAKASPDGPADLAPFRWTGRNSEKDRREAGRALLADLREYDRLGRDYRLIGHSHGGSVIWHALSESMHGKPLANLKGWITVGTPFLQFRPAWFYLWVALAAAVAVFVASQTTTLLMAAWPDRLLVLRHAQTSDLLGYVVEALVALTLTLLILAAVTIAVGLIVHLFPAIKDIPKRAQFAIGAVVALAVLGGAAWFVMHSDIIRANAPKAGLWATVGLASLTWIVASFFSLLTGILIYRGLTQWRRDRSERAAVERYGALWQPFTHAFDETVAGLAASRVSPYPIVAPHPGPEASVPRQLYSVALRPIARAGDDFIWWMLMRRLQGADIWGLVLTQASAAPQSLALKFGFSSLADPAARALLDDAAKGLGELGSELRGKLVKAGQVPDAVSAVEIVGSAIKWTEVVHTLYFRDIRMMGLLEEALAAKPREPVSAPQPLPPNRSYGFLPLTVASCLVSFAIIWSIGQGVQSLYAAYVKPNLAATQVDIAASASQTLNRLAIDKNPIVGAYLVRLVALGHLPNPAPLIPLIHDLETRASAVQRVAFAYGFAGQPDPMRVLDGVSPKSYLHGPLRDVATIHALAGLAAAGNKPDDQFVQAAVDVMRKANSLLGLRELYCTGIPALFAAGRPAEAMEFFGRIEALKGAGCDEAIDIGERGDQLPCVVHERIAFSTARYGKFDNALAIAKSCKDGDRMRTILLRLSAEIEDRVAAAEFLKAAARTGKAPEQEIVLRAAALANLGKPKEAAALMKPLLSNPTALFDLDENPFRPLFDVLKKTDPPGPLLNDIVAAQDRTSAASADAGQRLAFVRMLAEMKRSSDLAGAGQAAMANVAETNRNKPVKNPSELLDAAELAIVTGQPADAAPFLKDAMAFLIMAPRNRSRPRHIIRALSLAQSVSQAQLDLGLEAVRTVIEAEPDIEVRAKLTSAISNAYLKGGDPVRAMEVAREAGLPHRVLEAYCRVLDDAIRKQKSGTSDYGLNYSNWPAPSFILSSGEKKKAYRDSFGPQTCEAPWPIEK